MRVGVRHPGAIGCPRGAAGVNPPPPHLALRGLLFVHRHQRKVRGHIPRQERFSVNAILGRSGAARQYGLHPCESARAGTCSRASGSSTDQGGGKRRAADIWVENSVRAQQRSRQVQRGAVYGLGTSSRNAVVSLSAAMTSSKSRIRRGGVVSRFAASGRPVCGVDFAPAPPRWKDGLIAQSAAKRAEGEAGLRSRV